MTTTADTTTDTTTTDTRREELCGPFDWFGIPALIKRLLDR